MNSTDGFYRSRSIRADNSAHADSSRSGHAGAGAFSAAASIIGGASGALTGSISRGDSGAIEGRGVSATISRFSTAGAGWAGAPLRVSFAHEVQRRHGCVPSRNHPQPKLYLLRAQAALEPRVIPPLAPEHEPRRVHPIDDE